MGNSKNRTGHINGYSRYDLMFSSDNLIHMCRTEIMAAKWGGGNKGTEALPPWDLSAPKDKVLSMKQNQRE